MENRSVVARDCVWEELTKKKGHGIFWGDGTFYILIMVMIVRIHRTIHQKFNFIACKLNFLKEEK